MLQLDWVEKLQDMFYRCQHESVGAMSVAVGKSLGIIRRRMEHLEEQLYHRLPVRHPVVGALDKARRLRPVYAVNRCLQSSSSVVVDVGGVVNGLGAFDDKGVKIWTISGSDIVIIQPEQGRISLRIATGYRGELLSASPTGACELATLSQYEQNVSLWNLKTGGRRTLELPGCQPGKSHPMAIGAVGEDLLVVGCFKGTVKVIDRVQGTPLREFQVKGLTDARPCTTISNVLPLQMYGERGAVLIGGSGGRVTAFDPWDGAVLVELKDEHTWPLGLAAFQETGKDRLAALNT
mmetsp:Transcript_9484/g.26599  ORF Transcript_9484/g.26599 Transcript_9484/m.26599 type:complete len:293 (-) Transcript_9484:154-1032(-)